MNKKSVLVTVVVVFLFASVVFVDKAWCATVILYPSDDSYINDGATSTNYGSSTTLYVGYTSNTVRRAYLKFNLSSIPSDQRIVLSRLRLGPNYVTLTNPEVGAHYLVDDSWSEGTITWENAPTGFSEIATDTVIIDIYEDSFFTVTDDVETAYGDNGVYSVVLKSTNESTGTAAGFWSKELFVDLSPYLEVEYKPRDQYGNGSGTAEDPYLIYTPDHMDNVAQYSRDWDKHFKLMVDVDMSQCTYPQRSMIGEYLHSVPRAIRVESGTGKFYWADWGRDLIRRADLDGRYRQDIVSVPTPLGLAIDPNEAKIYWTENNYDKIQRADLDGSNVEDLVVTGLWTPAGIALDRLSGKMYWTDVGTGCIQRANLDGSSIETLLTGLLNPERLSLDIATNKMYWTETGGGRIGKANLDGTSAGYVITGLSSPYGLVVDATAGYIYWSQTGGIYRSNLDGSNIVLLVYVSPQSVFDMDIDFNGEKMYWLAQHYENERDIICRANLDGSGIEVLMRNYFTGSFDGNGHIIRNFILSQPGKEHVGIFGILDGTGTVVQNLGVVDPSISGVGGERIGGLIGQIFGGNVVQCFVRGGRITGGDLIGGLVGTGGSGQIVNCYTRTAVEGVNHVGGLQGFNFSISFLRCYAASSVSGFDYCGGLIGGVVFTSSPSCFWDVEISGQETSKGGIGKITVEMQTESTFTDAGWDFVGETVNGPNDIWDICEGTNYPKLVWSIPAGDFICPDGVNMFDFAILGDAWFSDPNMANWDPACDISDPNDNFIDGLDLEVFTDNYLTAL